MSLPPYSLGNSCMLYFSTMLTRFSGFPPAAGLRAHVELARISGYIVCNVYRIAPWDHSTKTTVQHVEQGLQRLRDWSLSLPATLQVDYEDLGTDRACCGLHLAYNQVRLLQEACTFYLMLSPRPSCTLTPVSDRDSDHTPHLLRRSQEGRCRPVFAVTNTARKWPASRAHSAPVHRSCPTKPASRQLDP